jgi:hypothetical protein
MSSVNSTGTSPMTKFVMFTQFTRSSDRLEIQTTPPALLSLISGKASAETVNSLVTGRGASVNGDDLSERRPSHRPK